MGPTMKERSDDPSHHERMLLPRSYLFLNAEEKKTGVKKNETGKIVTERKKHPMYNVSAIVMHVKCPQNIHNNIVILFFFEFCGMCLCVGGGGGGGVGVVCFLEVFCGVLCRWVFLAIITFILHPIK